MISPNLYAYLAAQSGITSLASTRIYPAILPQKPTYPAVLYREEGHDFEETFEGQQGFTKSYYIVDAFATTYAGVDALGAAIRTALQNTKGNFGGINIHKCMVESGPTTLYEDTVEAYRQTQVFTITHNEG
jgi:hypothetical protein